MAISVEAIIFYLILIDSIGANIVAFCCQKWYKKKFKIGFRHFPATKGWCAVYLILVLWIGFALYRLGILPY